MTVHQQQFNMRKFKELILYVANELQDDPNFGAVKLNKILFYADFFSYGHHGESITGASYMPLDEGPAPRKLLRAQEEMIEELDIHIQTRDHHGWTQKRIVPLRKANLDVLSSRDLDAIHDAMSRVRDMNATQVSELSHREIGWLWARKTGEDIPFGMVYLSPRPLSAEDIERGQELAAAHGW